MPAYTTGTNIDPFQAPSSAPALSLLPSSPFTLPADCEPCRVEEQFAIQIRGKIYRFTLRDKIVPEDPYLVALKAQAFSISRVEQYRGLPPPRTVRDFLVRTDLVI